jgi:predicted secreted protein
MSIASALVLYAVIWFMTFLIALPIRVRTQGDMGKIEPGTHAGAPEHHHLKMKAWITTGVAALLWVIIAGIILSGVISVRDIDWFNRMPPLE